MNYIRRCNDPLLLETASCSFGRYLLAECEAIEDVDLERSAKQGENELVEASTSSTCHSTGQEPWDFRGLAPGRFLISRGGFPRSM